MLGIERTKSLRLTWLVLALLLLLLAGACLHIHQMRQHGFFDQWFEWSLGDWGVRINYGCETSRGTVAGGDFRIFFGHYSQVGPLVVAYYLN